MPELRHWAQKTKTKITFLQVQTQYVTTSMPQEYLPGKMLARKQKTTEDDIDRAGVLFGCVNISSNSLTHSLSVLGTFILQTNPWLILT